jgi:hypothetical protein
MRKLKNGYECKCAWPESCFVQGDNNGVVINTTEGKESYSTAFFEAFPKEPFSTFIRGEGKDLAEAEKSAFTKLTTYLNCPEHEFERKNDGGQGKCKHCAIVVSGIFADVKRCTSCGEDDAGIKGVNREYYCASCYYNGEIMRQYLAPDEVAGHFDNIAEQWQFYALSMPEIYCYRQLDVQGLLKGKMANAIKSKVGEISRHVVSTQGIMQDVAINYFLTQPVLSGSADLFTQPLAHRLMAKPHIANLIAHYVMDMQKHVDDGMDAEEIGKVMEPAFAALATTYVKLMIDATHQLGESGETFGGDKRAQTREEKNASLRAGLSAIFNALENAGSEGE